MMTRTLALATGAFAVTIALLSSISHAEDRAPGIEPAGAFKVGELVMTGPFAHENLTVYLIHGPEHVKARGCLTLQEAIQKKAAIVHETGAANELAVENLSADVDIYIQAGEIVKGGLQDRTLAMDYLVPPKSGFVPVKVFCVDLGRWEARPGESMDRFDDAPACVAGGLLKFAVLRAANQDQVWAAIKVMQHKLAVSVGHGVADRKWVNAYQLTVENKAVQQATLKYEEHLASIIDHPPADGSTGGKETHQPQVSGLGNVIGFAVAINGKLSSVDVYESHEIFARLWPKLLNSAAVEAFAEIQKDKTFEPVSLDALKAVIEGVDHTHVTPKEVTRRTITMKRESKDAILFETYDRLDPRAGAPGTWVHRSYLIKTGYNPPAPNGAPQDAGFKPIIVPH